MINVCASMFMVGPLSIQTRMSQKKNNLLTERLHY
jgi:hypothetical protein